MGNKIIQSAAVVFLLMILLCDHIPVSDVDFVNREIILPDGRSLSLSDRRVRLSGKDGEPVWESEGGYKVQDMLLSDLDRDGSSELILLLWKKGRYGKHRPFWVHSDESIYSQHIFIYSMKEALPRPLWFASDIGRLLRRMKLLDEQNIILTEDIRGSCELWYWRSFGLKNLDNGVSFIAFGDNLIHESIYEYGLYQNGGDFGFLYDDLVEEISSADIAALQQESILVKDNRLIGGYPYFGTPVRVGEAVVRAGFDVVSCAGNHALDRGMTGIDDTFGFYEDHGLACLGIQPSSDTEYRPYRLISKNGIRFALLDYTYGTGGIDVSDKYPFAVHYLPREFSEGWSFPERVSPEGIQNETAPEGTARDGIIEEGAARDGRRDSAGLLSDLRSARENADVVVVFVHWGRERMREPDRAQRELAAMLAGGGADVIIGTHPHVIQKPEVLRQEDGRQTLVCYSLGNFRADQGWEDTRIGAELCFKAEYTWEGVRITDWQLKNINTLPF